MQGDLIMQKNETYQGFETLLSELLMKSKMHLYVCLFLSGCQLSITLLISYFFYSHAWTITAKFLINSIFNMSIAGVSAALSAIFKLLQKSFLIILITSPIWFLYPRVLRKFKSRAEEQSRDKYIRGSKLISENELNIKIEGDKKDTFLKIGNVNIPAESETEHFIVIGRTGVGKTVLLSSVAEKLRERQGIKAVIYDAEGTYLRRFYNPNTDIIFNPLDTRGRGWTIFNDATSVMDLDTIAESLIPIPIGSNQDPFWNRSAQDVFVSILRHLFVTGKATNMDIYKSVFESRNTLSTWFQNEYAKRGFRHLEETGKGDRVGSIFSVMNQYTKSFEYISQSDGDFSIQNWLTDDKSGFIFITNTEKSKETLKPILSLFIDQLAQKILSLPESLDRRVYLLLDEFPSLQKLPSITSLLTRGRKRGTSLWIGIQDVAQLEKVYGREEAKTIMDNCASAAIFACSDDYSAEHLSKRVGDTEILRVDQNVSMGVEDGRDGISLNTKEVVKRLILPSEIINLEKLNLYLKLSGYDITKTILSLKNYQNITKPFIFKDIFNLSNLIPVNTDTGEPSEPRSEKAILFDQLFKKGKEKQEKQVINTQKSEDDKGDEFEDEVKL